jgi:hypothetical protein
MVDTLHNSIAILFYISLSARYIKLKNIHFKQEMLFLMSYVLCNLGLHSFCFVSDI